MSISTYIRVRVKFEGKNVHFSGNMRDGVNWGEGGQCVFIWVYKGGSQGR